MKQSTPRPIGWEEPFYKEFYKGNEAIFNRKGENISRIVEAFVQQQIEAAEKRGRENILNELPDTQFFVKKAVESERKRISEEIIRTIGASELGILKNKTTSEVLKDLHSIINK